MTSDRPCPECGTPMGRDAPSGLCPQCLVRQGLTLLGGDQDGSPGQAALPDAGSTRRIPPSEAPAAVPASTPGARQFGDYELLHEIAHGGMGVVYAARQISLNRPVALKMILSGQLATSAEVQRFRIEAEAAAKLDHPHIVPIYEIGDWQGHYFFSMKLIEGGRLSDRVAERPLEPRTAAALLVKIARAVHYAHQHGVLHRDLKPTNILIDAKGEPHLTDFGLAKLLEQESHLTQSKAVLGTANYMAPEQAAGDASRITTAVDVYGLGAILYEMLTARAPFHGQSLVETLRQVVEQEPPRPGSVNPAIDRDLETVCLKCLEKPPAQRYDSAEALALELERWLAGEPILARPITAWERTVKWAKRKPAIAALLGLLVLVGAVGFGGVLWQWSRAEDALRGLGQEKRSLRRNLYVADMNLAQRALEQNNLGRAVQLLRKYLPAPGEEDLRGFEWRYLWDQAKGNEQFTFPVGDYINSVAFSPDGRWLAAGGHGLDIRVWEVASRQAVTRLFVWPAGVQEGYAGAIGWNQLQFSPDGKFLLAQVERNLRVWNTATWREVGKIARLALPVLFLPDGATAVANDETRPAFLDINTWQPKPAPGPFAELGCPRACSIDGRFAVAASATWGLLQLWDLPAAKKVNQFTLPQDPANYWALSPDGTFLVAGNWQGQAKLWDCRAGREVADWQAHASPLYGLAFSPDARTLITAGHDQLIHLWDLATQTRTATLKGHLNEVWAVASSPDGRLLASGGKDTTVKLWPMLQPRQETILPEAVQPRFFSPDGRRLAAFKKNRAAAWWDVATCQEVEALPASQAGAAQRASEALSANGEILAVAGPDGKITVQSPRGAGPAHVLETQAEPVLGLAFSPGGQWLAGATRAEVWVWDWAQDRLLSRLQNAGGALIALSPDGARLAAATPGYTVKLWDVPRRRLVAELQAHKWIIAALVFSPDSRLLLAASIDANASLWDAIAGKLEALLSGHKEGVSCAAFSPDGHTIATGSTDETVKLWSTATRHELFTFAGFGGDIGTVLFSPDGNTLAVGCQNTSAVWKPVQLRRAAPLAAVRP